MEIHISLHPIRRFWIIVTVLVTRFLKWKFKADNIRYLCPVMGNFKKHRWRHVAPTDVDWGFVEIMGQVWGYSYDVIEEEKDAISL